MFDDHMMFKSEKEGLLERSLQMQVKRSVVWGVFLLSRVQQLIASARERENEHCKFTRYRRRRGRRWRKMNKSKRWEEENAG